MRVQLAQHDDVKSWFELAAEVEHLFGPMVSEPGFHEALNLNIERGSAFCIRENDGGPGAPLTAGLLFSPEPPVYQIGWLSVASRCRRQGLATALVRHTMSLVRPPAELTVMTFGPDDPEGGPARQFYMAMGFAPSELSDQPEGNPRQVFRRTFDSVRE
ncbi:MAG: GNAT family N-acetyltransferase [Planctomycetes bacterium]|nr:GNAT family N-acetyltransferase [Planctomycetota bacterium]